MTSVPGSKDSPVLDVRAVALLLGCSARHVFRLSGEGKMPPPVRIGRLIRWRRSDLDAWISSGCPARKGEDAE